MICFCYYFCLYIRHWIRVRRSIEIHYVGWTAKRIETLVSTITRLHSRNLSIMIVRNLSRVAHPLPCKRYMLCL